jgi:hypothetical protein
MSEYMQPRGKKRKLCQPPAISLSSLTFTVQQPEQKEQLFTAAQVEAIMRMMVRVIKEPKEPEPESKSGETPSYIS